MSGEVTFVPTPVVQLAFACIDELAKAGLVEAGTNADHLIAITHALQAAEKRGAIAFTDEMPPRYRTAADDLRDGHGLVPERIEATKAAAL